MKFIQQRYQGLIYLIFAAFSYSIMAVFVKFAGDHLPPLQIIFLRSVILVPFIIYLARHENLNLLGRNHLLLILRSLFGFLGMTAYFTTLSLIPIADSTILLYTNPLFTGILGVFF